MRRDRLPNFILDVLDHGALHGYAIAREVERRSKDLLRDGEGLLYPALRRLEAQGFVVGAWTAQLTGESRKVYELTDAGRAKLIRLRSPRFGFDRLGESNGGKLNGQPA